MITEYSVRAYIHLLWDYAFSSLLWDHPTAAILTEDGHHYIVRYQHQADDIELGFRAHRAIGYEMEHGPRCVR